jgi:hypothetical protein
MGFVFFGVTMLEGIDVRGLAMLEESMEGDCGGEWGYASAPDLNRRVKQKFCEGDFSLPELRETAQELSELAGARGDSLAGRSRVVPADSEEHWNKIETQRE